MNECMHCSSTDLQPGVAVSARNKNTGDVANDVGPWFKTGKKAWLSGDDITEIEPLLAEICRSCGTVRFYVENPQKDWRVVRK